MKWWYWLVLELLIIFGTIAWIYFFPSEFEYDRRNRMIENHTIEQNVGENQIEGGVVSISGSVKKTELKDQLESF